MTVKHSCDLAVLDRSAGVTPCPLSVDGRREEDLGDRSHDRKASRALRCPGQLMAWPLASACRDRVAAAIPVLTVEPAAVVLPG